MQRTGGSAPRPSERKLHMADAQGKIARKGGEAGMQNPIRKGKKAVSDLRVSALACWRMIFAGRWYDRDAVRRALA
jgi:hypothetical protein